MSSGKYYPQRSRSRDKHHHNSYRGRSQSQESDRHKRKSDMNSMKISHKMTKRVKFNQNDDIKIFRKEDQPSSKGLSETQIMEYMQKIQSEKGSSLMNTNWDNAKHVDAQNENNLIKEKKEKEKILTQKLQAMKEEMDYYSPLILNLPQMEVKVEPGYSSTEKKDHSDRLNDVLGCFYVNWKQTPSEPTFQIQNKSTSCQPKNISFDKLSFDNLKDLTLNTSNQDKKDAKPLKGILKLSQQEIKKQRAENEPPRIDPKLISIIQDININKANYTKQKTQALLKPYKESGELDNLMKNKQLLSNLLRAPSQQPPVRPVQPYQNNGMSYGMYGQPMRHSPSPQPQKPEGYGNYQQPGYRSDSASRAYPENNNNNNPYRSDSTGRTYTPPMGYNPNNSYQPEQPFYQNHGNNPYYRNPAMGGNMSGYPPNYQSQNQQPQQFMNKNYKTVPCKYFHSGQGCVKGNNCTYIHDQKYAGQTSPLMRQYSVKPDIGTPGGYGQAGDNGQRQSMQRYIQNQPKEGYYIPPPSQYPQPPSNYPYPPPPSGTNNLQN